LNGIAGKTIVEIEQYHWLFSTKHREGLRAAISSVWYTGRMFVPLLGQDSESEIVEAGLVGGAIVAKGGRLS